MPPTDFINKLYRMATYPENENAIGFSEDGTALEIRDAVLLKEILPKYFRHQNINSFCRQLNNYEFKHSLRNELKPLAPNEEAKKDGYVTMNVYTHEYFRREEPNLLERIYRRGGSQKRREMNIIQNGVMTPRDSVLEQLKEQNARLLAHNTQLSAENYQLNQANYALINENNHLRASIHQQQAWRTIFEPHDPNIAFSDHLQTLFSTVEGSIMTNETYNEHMD